MKKQAKRQIETSSDRCKSRRTRKSRRMEKQADKQVQIGEEEGSRAGQGSRACNK